MNRALVWTALMLGGASIAYSETAQEKEPPRGIILQLHRYSYLGRIDAENTVTVACMAAAGNETCRVRGSVDGVVTVQASPEGQRQVAELLAERDAAAAPRTVRFRVYVLEERPGPQARTLPEPVERAVHDVESVLGKKFAFTDSAELRLTRQGITTLGKDLRAEIVFHTNKDPKKLIVDTFRLQSNGGKDGVLDTSFGIAIGETVAVGTMKTSMGTLITLVTAVD